MKETERLTVPDRWIAFKYDFYPTSRRSLTLPLSLLHHMFHIDHFIRIFILFIALLLIIFSSACIVSSLCLLVLCLPSLIAFLNGKSAERVRGLVALVLLLWSIRVPFSGASLAQLELLKILIRVVLHDKTLEVESCRLFVVLRGGWS